MNGIADPAATAPASLPLIDKARLGVEIIGAYVQARWLLRRRELPAVLRVLRRSQLKAGRPLAVPAADGARLGAAVVRVLEPIPADTRCLMRSLVLTKLLAQRGGDAALVIAVRPGEEDSLAAHAWVELDGRPLLPPAGSDHGRLATL